MKNKVTTSRFLSWYFSDSNDFIRVGSMAADSLKKYGTFTVTARELMDSCILMPASICVTPYDDYDYEPKYVELIDDL
jgi:hypothetical protein